MSEMLETLPWDSAFFGLPIGRVTASRVDKQIVSVVLAEARDLGLRCLYFEADPNDPTSVTTAEENGFHLVDVRVILEQRFDNRLATTPGYSISSDLVVGPPHNNEISRLEDIAAQIGSTSRFNFDKNFESGSFERLYRLWIKNACQGFADVVLVARWSQGGEAIGLISCNLRDRSSHIQLAGVHSDHRQRGVGTGLVQSALDWARREGAFSMQVVTQARNVPAQRLYQQMGFFTKAMTLYYHKWL